MDDPGFDFGAREAAFRGWREEDRSWIASAPGGAEAKVWTSAVSRKWVLAVTLDGTTLSRRVASADEGKALADQWLEDLRAVQGQPAPKRGKR